jgi:hypothetical protein
MTHATNIHNELHNIHNSPNIIRINISMSEMSGACSTHGGYEKYMQMLVGKHEGKRPHGRC